MAAVGVLVIGLCLVRKETQTRLEYQVGDVVAKDDGSWAYDFLIGIGNEAPSYEMLNFVTAWNRAEGGDRTAQFNPLNTTQPMPGDSCFNYLSGRCGVRNYASYKDGLEANVTTVLNGRYVTLLSGLRTNNTELAFSGLAEGVWGTNTDTVSEVYATLPVPVPEQSITVLQGEGSPRQQLVAYALTLQGQTYRTGGGTAAFRAGELESGSGDCSSTMQHIYHRVLGIDIGNSTFTQFTNGFKRNGQYGNSRTVPISASELQPGDLWYGTYPDDEHTGMVVGDVTGDGSWDLMDQGGKTHTMKVNNDFLNDPYFMDHLIGFARIL